MRIESDQILRARAGDRRALEALIRSYQGPIAAFIAGRIGDRSSVPDLCQNVFVKMALALSKLRTTDTFEPWLYRIAENACRDFQRRERFRRRLFVRLERGHDSTGDADPPREGAQLAELQQHLAGIEAGQRELLALSLEKPRSYGELAALTRLSVPTVKSRLFRAREALRRLVGNKETLNEP